MIIELEDCFFNFTLVLVGRLTILNCWKCLTSVQRFIRCTWKQY